MLLFVYIFGAQIGDVLGIVETGYFNTFSCREVLYLLFIKLYSIGVIAAIVVGVCCLCLLILIGVIILVIVIVIYVSKNNEGYSTF